MQIEAFDHESGLVSTIDGFRFDWTIEGKDIIKKATLQEIDSNIKGRTDVFVVKGVALGSAIVRVKLLEPGYEHLQEQVFEVVVAEPFVVLP
jgi:hypothetical protein